MYGLILENIVTFLQKKYGAGHWKEIAYIANVEDEHFKTDQVYSEGIVPRIVWAAMDVTGQTNEELLEEIGGSFYDFISTYEYDKILRVLGRTFTEFLNGLDNLHEYLKFSYPKLKPPSFYCEHESRTGLTLHYRSKRRGFLHYVKGQIKFIAKILYDTDVKIELLDHENEDNMEHIIFRIHFNNTNFSKVKVDAEKEDLIRSSIKITSDVFFDIFPFMIVFNRGMRVRNIGLALLRLMPRLIGKKINQEFIQIRPLIRFRWEEIMLYSNNIFELMSMEPIWEDDQAYIFRAGDARELQEERRRMTEDEKKKFLTLKGPMMYMEEWESICFLGIPVMNDLTQMYKTGLFINDFATHDSSRDLVMTSTQQAAEIKLLLEQEAEKSDMMGMSMSKLKEEREKADNLLYQLLPKAVADDLRKGVSAVNTCETFEAVTILFTDVVGFTTICSGIQPLDVVRFLNDMYSVFDQLTETHGVFKVETIGDAYMIVGGAPVRTDFHAEYVADCSLAIIAATEHLIERASNQKIRIRAGLHTGTVVAGVVGLKMPRYCLFGDTVFIANKMESSGKPMQIQISETTKAALDEIDPDLFNTTKYTVYEHKEGEKLKTYFLDGKNGPPREPEEDEMDEADYEVAEIERFDRRDSSIYEPVSDAEIERASRLDTHRSQGTSRASTIVEQ